MISRVAVCTMAICFCVSFSVYTQSTYRITELKLAQSDSSYSIDGSYPKVEGLADKAAQSRCNTTISSLVNGWLQGFTSTSHLAFTRFMTRAATGPVSFLDISYDVELNGERFLSLTLEWSGRPAGSPHPVVELTGLTFDLESGSEIFLYDLFEPGSHYLDTLSHVCAEELLGQNASLNKVIEGTSATYGNFHNFTLDDESLTIMFGPEQVDTYKGAPAGRSVKIPYYKLENILRKHGPLSKLFK